MTSTPQTPQPALSEAEDRFKVADYCLQVARGRRPLKIKMIKTVRPDFEFLLPIGRRGIVLVEGQTYPAKCNKYGAACGVAEDGRELGVKPDEFEVTEWQEPAPSLQAK